MNRRSPAYRMSRHDLIPGQVVVLGCTATALAVGLSLYTAGTLNWVFAAGFIAICATLPLAATREALLTSVVLPPLLLAAVAVAVAIWIPGAIDVAGLSESAGTTQRSIAAFADHGSTLGIGCAVALLAAGLRLAGLKRQADSEAPDPRSQDLLP